MFQQDAQCVMIGSLDAWPKLWNPWSSPSTSGSESEQAKTKQTSSRLLKPQVQFTGADCMMQFAARLLKCRVCSCLCWETAVS